MGCYVVNETDMKNRLSLTPIDVHIDTCTSKDKYVQNMRTNGVGKVGLKNARDRRIVARQKAQASRDGKRKATTTEPITTPPTAPSLPAPLTHVPVSSTPSHLKTVKDHVVSTSSE